MRHTISAEEFGVRLRPVRMEDAPFIVWLRNLGHAVGRVGDSATEVAAQEKWLGKYFEREGDWYFLIETLGGIPLGTYGLYDLRGRSAEGGRFVVRPGVPAGMPGAIVGLDIAFNVIKLEELRGTTVATNHHVLSLNRKFGFHQIKVEKNAQVINGQPVDIVHVTFAPHEWPAVRARLAPLAKVAEPQIREWEKANPNAGQPENWK